MQQEKTKQKGLMTEGVIWKELLLFSVPLLLGNLFQQLYNAVDSVVVGNYIGAQALAAVGSSAPVINLLVSFFMGLSVGAGVIISRYFGARNMESLQDSIHTSLALTMTAGIFMTLFGIIFSPTILRWIGTPSDVMSSSVLYLRIYFGGILSVMLYNMGSGILRAVGDSKNPLYFLIVSSITNILLDLLFVIVFDMGIAGVGWATLIAQTISAVLTVMSYSMALTTFTGQNMGAKKYDRVKQGARSGIIMSLLTTIAISALLLIFGEQVLSIFSDNPKVISYGLYMMHVLAPFYIFLAISHAFNGIIRGAGITTIPMIVMITCWCGMRMTWILASVPIFHDIGVVFMGWPLTWAASALWLFLYYKKGNWMKRSMY